MRRLLALALFACLNLSCARADQRPDWARLFDDEDGEPALNHLCAGYTRFFSHVDLPIRPMRKLLQEGRPAADIMNLLQGPEPA